ncbi:plexin-C1-like isoform X1 [Astyanax mexicanus]|uniref:Plexin C1 n=2 Tax=Astyanax mexicanus TaxID=7994 RepID=A0A8B9JNL5_ASTMX|nr:plexin-C1-like isoform X1 [Astyanax mexicanus]
MKTVLVLILLFFKVGVYSLTENSVNGDISNFAVENGKVFVLTDSQIIQMKHDLIVEERREISNHTHPNTVTILLPFQTNKTLITCGTFRCGYCEVLDSNNISTSIHWEDVLAGPFVDESSVAFLVDFNQGKPDGGTYMLVARKKEDTVIQNPQHKCPHNGVVTLWNTLHSQHGGIFSKTQSESTDTNISPGGDVEWVDGFQTSSSSHTYLLVNIQSVTAPAVIVLKMENSDSKSDMIKSLQGSELECCDDKPRRRLLSSSGVISSGSPFYWVGVFTAHEDPENTVLAIYNFSQIPNQVPSQFTCSPACKTMKKGNAVLTPHAVLLNHTSMTSVAAEKKGSWIVIYIGTRNGQLMKMVLDKEWRSSCVTVLYKSDDDRMVFPRMQFDQVDHKHIYIALRNQIKRIAVTCSDLYKTLRDCRASQDPLCGWCVSTSMCSTSDECSNSSWISIPEDSFQKNLTTFHTGVNSTMPEISSLQPSLVSFQGRNNAVIKGKNLRLVKRIHFQGFMECAVTETKVLDGSSDTLLKFNIPKGNKGNAKVCVVTADGQCHSSATITYGSAATCTRLQPTVSWASGRRKIQVIGENLAYVETVHVASDAKTLISNKTFWFQTSSLSKYKENVPFSVSLRVGNLNVSCADKLIYHPDPEFTTFSYSNVEKDLLVTIQKTEDKLNISTEDINVQGWFKGNPHVCHIQEIKSTAVICKIFGGNKDVTSVDLLKVEVGEFKAELVKNTPVYIYILVALIILILIGSLVGVLIHRKSQRKMSERMNERLEVLECEIRSEIRQGFVDLQTENSDLIQNVGAIPFLDYKHFALKIFFPEGGPLANMMIKDISQVAVKIEVDEKCQVFSALIRDQTFLTCFVHALEEQKYFSIKDKCVVASLLTVALHGDLPYLTQLMEDLLQSLMDQPSNAQPKLLLRRTESIVEKLLTNWMSICLYGFLRESVGQPLFLLVSALTQQISKGPVDAVTEKALYTLNEDWLLWQAQDFNFSPLKLNVLFAVGTEGEVSESLEVNALTCDTIEQVKEKILQTFQRKFGFPYTQQQREIDIEYEKGGRYTPLEEVDGSSEVQGEVTMLNTLKHYQVPDGASIKVMTKKLHAPLSPQTSVKDDQNFSTKYFHLIDPDIDKDESNHPERKKLKLKEIYLTKLLSTKVAVHSFVENLFRSIWGMPNNKAPSAVKYFFDFLDAQAEKKKVTDPDVVHIWKTNSLPLRFWINILKNPNFVFSDLEKTPHLDACLSVIAQAFMDSFSLTDQQLGKHAPTNKLLYAKDIPQYKQEVKMYYKLVKDQPSVSSQEFKTFLQDESKKHESEFNESAALRELYKYMDRYFSEITEKLNQRDASSKLKEEMNRVKELFDDMKKSSWT